MKIETILPHPALVKYIDFYYFIKESSPDFKSTHFSFPHTSNVVSIYKNANVRSETGTIEIFHDLERNFLTIVWKETSSIFRLPGQKDQALHFPGYV